MQDQSENITERDDALTKEWQRFFPGSNSRFGDVVKDFAEFIRAREQHDFSTHDMLIGSLDEVYFRTTEPTRFVDMIHNAWKQLQIIIEDQAKALVLFESFGPGGWWMEDGKELLPFNGHPRNNARRAKSALRRVEQWIKIRLLAPSEQLIVLLKSIPVVVWHKASSVGINDQIDTVVSLPAYEHEDFSQVIETLYQETQKEIGNHKKKIAKSIIERLVKSLKPISNIDREYINSIEHMHGERKNIYHVERLPIYYRFMKWGDIMVYSHLLATASLPKLFWMALGLSLAVRRNWATKICDELIASEQPSTLEIKPTNSLLELRQIAMLYYYKGKIITKNNASDIAAEYQKAGKTSGRDLIQYWKDDANPNAMTVSRSKREATHFINAIQAIIPELDSEQKKQAENDIITIKKKIL